MNLNTFWKQPAEGFDEASGGVVGRQMLAARKISN